MLMLLHEMCHAIQDHDNRLVPIPRTNETAIRHVWRAYQNELEAMRFAIDTYANRAGIAYSRLLHLLMAQYRDYTFHYFFDTIVMNAPEVDWQLIVTHLKELHCLPEDTSNRMSELRWADASKVPH